MFTTPVVFPSDENGFVPPSSGGPIGFMRGEILHTNVTAKNLFRLPANSVPVHVAVVVTEAFDAGTTNTIDVGIDSNGDYFVDGMDVSSTGYLGAGTTGVIPTSLTETLPDGCVVNATFIPSGTAATEGKAVVYIFYAVMGDGF